MSIKQGESFQAGEVWLSPAGYYWKVRAVVNGQAELKQNMHGTGRLVRRRVGAVIGWALEKTADSNPNSGSTE